MKFTYNDHAPMRLHRLSIAIMVSGLFIFVSQGVAQRGGEEPVRQPGPSRSIQFGVFGGGALAPNSAEFATLPGVISCQGDTTFYAGSTGGGFSFAAVGGITPGSGDGFLSHIGLSVKVGLTSTSSTFETNEFIGQSISPTGELGDITSLYTIKGGLSTLTIEPTALYQISPKTPLMIGIGPTLGFLIGATYDQSESVASPAGATFADGSRERNVRSGDIEETNGMLLGAMLSLAYDIKASSVISIRPEISGTLGFNGPVSGVDWTQHSIRAGVSIMFTPASKESSPLGPTK